MPAGRPTKITEAVLKKLEIAFALGCTDEEACFDAGISHQTLYNYQHKHPEFIDRKQGLKNRPITIARKSVINNMKKDGKLALQYLERKKKDEFAPMSKTEHSGSIGLGSITDDELDRELNELGTNQEPKRKKINTTKGKGKA